MVHKPRQTRKSSQRETSRPVSRSDVQAVLYPFPSTWPPVKGKSVKEDLLPLDSANLVLLKTWASKYQIKPPGRPRKESFRQSLKEFSSDRNRWLGSQYVTRKHKGHNGGSQKTLSARRLEQRLRDGLITATSKSMPHIGGYWKLQDWAHAKPPPSFEARQNLHETFLDSTEHLDNSPSTPAGSHHDESGSYRMSPPLRPVGSPFSTPESNNCEGDQELVSSSVSPSSSSIPLFTAPTTEYREYHPYLPLAAPKRSSNVFPDLHSQQKALAISQSFTPDTSSVNQPRFIPLGQPDFQPVTPTGHRVYQINSTGLATSAPGSRLIGSGNGTRDSPIASLKTNGTPPSRREKIVLTLANEVVLQLGIEEVPPAPAKILRVSDPLKRLESIWDDSSPEWKPELSPVQVRGHSIPAKLWRELYRGSAYWSGTSLREQYRRMKVVMDDYEIVGANSFWEKWRPSGGGKQWKYTDIWKNLLKHSDADPDC